MVIDICIIGCFYLACIMIFLGKAMADITSNETSWETSVFSKKNSKDSFWGSKEFSYIRKDHKNKILDYMFHTILVPFTDIWHLSNLIRRIGIYLAITLSMLIGKFVPITLLSSSIIISVFIVFNIIGFHLSYHNVLRVKKGQ